MNNVTQPTIAGLRHPLSPARWSIRRLNIWTRPCRRTKLHGVLILGTVNPKTNNFFPCLCRSMAWLLPTRTLAKAGKTNGFSQHSEGQDESAREAILEKVMKGRQPSDLMLRCKQWILFSDASFDGNLRYHSQFCRSTTLLSGIALRTELHLILYRRRENHLRTI